jgi:hypothetical protein
MELHRPKTSYHPFVLIAFHLNCLPDNLSHAIPHSTRFDWLQRDFQNSFGFAWYIENKNLFLTLELITKNKKLLKINWALLRVIAIKLFIKKHSVAIATWPASIKIAIVVNILKTSQV